MKADGRINIAINVDGKEVERGRKSVQGLESDARKVRGGADQASSGIKNISASLALVKIGAAAFSALVKSMDAAISRFDTFNTFPDVMSALGESTEDSEQAIDKLSDGIEGLPTKLDDIVSVTQRMYSSFKNLDESTDTALALNNALLASGASAVDAQRGTDQYIQALQKGKFELEEWKTLQETMGVGLSLIAESFGMTERELKSALDSGQISMMEFNDRMVELGTGSGELAELAKINSQTIATALTNLRNTASRGLADIIQAFSDMVEEVSGKSLYENLEGLKDVVNSAFKAISNTIKALAPVIKALVRSFQGLLRVAKTLSPVIFGLVAAYTALLVINKVNDIIDNNVDLLSKVAMSGKKLTVTTKAQIAAQAAKTKATIADTTAQMANTGALTIGQIAIGVLTGNLGLATAATALKTKAVTALSGVLKTLTGPIGWVVAGVGLLVAGGVALVKWLNRSTEEGERLAKQTEALGESTKELTGEVESNNKEYEKQIRRTEASTEANIDLAKKIGELSSQESLNSKQKKELQEDIELLNNEVEGLNVAYDEEAKALNMSSEEMQKRIELMGEEEKYNAAKERQLEISQEQYEVDMQLKDVIALRELYHEQLEKGEITKKEYKDSVAELDEQEKELNDTLEILSVQYGVTEEAMIEAMENQHAIAITITGEQILLYEALSESLQGTVDRMAESYQTLQGAATDAFNKLDTDTEHTMESMIETLRHNQEVVEEWGENQAAVMEWAGENGYDNLIPYIESMGIDSAAELALLANATDEEMEAFAEAMEEGGATGKSAFLEAHNMSEEDYKAVEHLVTDTASALSAEIENADFANIGKDIPGGMSEGVEEGTPEAVDAIKNMAEEGIEEVRNALQTRSPSRVFMDIGEDTASGLALGVLNNIKNVTNVLRILASQMPPIFNHVPGQFRQIGQQIMTGLNSGIISGRGRVLAQARSIASAVTATMQRSLRIQSPSGVMRDDVGRWIPEGVAEGIEKSSSTVYDAIEKMNTGMIKMNTPELALGVAGGGYNHVVNNNPQTSSVDNRNFTFNANASGTESNDREFYERLFKEFKWYIQQEGGAFS